MTKVFCPVCRADLLIQDNQTYKMYYCEKCGIWINQTMLGVLEKFYKKDRGDNNEEEYWGESGTLR